MTKKRTLRKKDASNQIYSLESTVASVIACPACVSHDDDTKGILIEEPELWLECQTSGCRYPIVDGIPVLLVSVGKAFAKVPKSKLPTRPSEQDVATWTV